MMAGGGTVSCVIRVAKYQDLSRPKEGGLNEGEFGLGAAIVDSLRTGYC